MHKGLYLCTVIIVTMKLYYHCPHIELVYNEVESGILADSLIDSNPVDDAIEGDTSYWGGWF